MPFTSEEIENVADHAASFYLYRMLKEAVGRTEQRLAKKKQPLAVDVRTLLGETKRELATRSAKTGAKLA